jgi:hypothetical protein
MSLPAQNVALQAVANPGQTVFPFGWRCDDPTTVKVWVNDVADGGFAIFLNADQTAAPGGTITRGVACAGGEVVTVERTSPQTQTTNLGRYIPFPADTVTTMLDKAVMLLQEVAAVALSKCLKAARSSLSHLASLELPAPVAGKALAWVDAGAGLFRLDLLSIVGGGPNWRGAFNALTPYTVGDAVGYLGSSYVLYLATPAGTLPTDASKWMLLAQAGVTGAPALDAVLGTSPWNSVNDNNWHDVPGLSIVTPAYAAPAATIVSWLLSIAAAGGGGNGVTRLMIDGVEIPGTRLAQGNQDTQWKFSGTYMATLGAGAHTIKVQYRTPTAFTLDTSTDFESSRLQLARWN